MTEYADRRNKELASAFITSTCQLIPKPSLAYADHMHNLLASKLPVPTSYTIICGSLAEFYIRPLITCIDDEDFLVAKAGELVFSGEFPELPRDFSGLVEKIEGYKIESYEVVQNGCHVVCVKHRSCRNDKYQWRFSFSLAEVILLQSWTQTQQIVYHLLRFLSKRELIQKDCPKEDEVLCTYHLKTLMLWACEQKSPEWWNSSSVISICSELLKMLSKLFKRN